ncbi:helix-turn-helix domain-containing protein [Flavobacterium silvaticum]|uniref:AraC family transcriptional regulator n=1 Tax=Flavobacterium silvaticum TaxID=1852020 RepID=A0A972JFP9_9FLAO|nr:helix-turn-helix domain-containing protein [Flavobacterium silvaticum]NMH27401.1 AraC family transcriptional regulator [Flavobacterium silvaticum]
MKNILAYNLFESLNKREDVYKIENEIYISETGQIDSNGLSYPLKTKYTVCCICIKGELTGKIDLKEYHIKAPGMAISLPGQILEHGTSSADFLGILIYMSESFTKNFNLLMGHSIAISIMDRPYVKLTDKQLEAMLAYCDMAKSVMLTKDNPHKLATITHLTIAYFYGIGYFLHQVDDVESKSNDKIITDRFLHEVRQHFKKERRVEFYAEKLQLSPNYLSHKVKDVTNKTAGQWIDEYIALEAKALLKSTNMTIQQIADELNFPSQSFFGKFFKRVVGISPKYYK